MMTATRPTCAETFRLFFALFSGLSPDFRSVLRCLSLLALVVGGLLPTVRAAEPVETTGGLEFTSSPGRVTLDSGFSLAGRSFTVEAWIWLNAAGADRPVLAQVGGGNLLHLLVRNNRLHLGFSDDDLTGTAAVPTNEWVHVAYTYDEATRTQRLYLNGQNDGSRVADASFAENNLPLHIGAYVDFSLNPFDGRMLELRIWDHARDAATLSAGRFSTPPVDAPGLDALFTFEGSTGTNVTEATGQLTGNQIHGAVAVVEPVLPPELLPAEAAIELTVPAGSLASAVQGYTSSLAPAAAYPDAGGAQLSDGVVPYRVWGSPWFDFSGAWTQPIVAWENASPELTFTFTERVRIDAITVHAANSGGAEGVALPETVQIASPGGYAASFPVVAGGDIGGVQAIELDSLGIFTDALTITLDGASDWLALGEVAFEGSVLAEPALQADDDWISLPAKRFLGLDPDAVDASAIHLEVVFEEGATRFEFPRAIDDYGVQAVVEWSTDLVDWTPVPYAPATDDGLDPLDLDPEPIDDLPDLGDLGDPPTVVRAVAELTPPPAEGRAFFRLLFPDGPPSVAGPGSFDAAESDSPLEFALSNRLGVDSPLDPASLELMAINDQALSALGEATPTANGGTLQFLSDGTVRYTTAPGLADGQVAEETFTYTVADRFGRTVRNQFILSVTGENDAPTAGNISATHSAGAVPAGITYQYFEGDFSSEAAFDTATPVSSGRMPSFSLDPATATEDYGFEFTGELFVPAAGPYTFYTGTENGIVLDIDGQRVVENSFEAPATERSGTVTLEAGTHTIRVRTFDAAEPEALTVDYSGPGLPRTAIPPSAFPRLEDLPLGIASDPDDGDVLRISHLNGEALAEGAPAVLPSGATLTLAGDGQVTYHPAPGKTLLHEATAAENFTYTVTDTGGLSATATADLTLARQNTAPTVNDFTFGVGNDQNGSFSLHDEASDAGSDALRVTHINGELLLDEEEATLPSLARVGLRQEEQGRVFYDGQGAFVRTAAAQTATDQVTVTFVDAAGVSASATATVEVDLTQDFANNLHYEDARFSPELFDVPWMNTVTFGNAKAKPIPDDEDDPIEPGSDTAEIYAVRKADGFETPRVSRSLQRGEQVFHTFEPLDDQPLGETDFFDAYHVRLEGIARNSTSYTAFLRGRDAPEFYDLSIPAAIKLTNPYRHSVEVVVYAKHKATSQETSRITRLLEPGETLSHTFTPVEASEPGDPNFFELHDVHVETPAGAYFHYASRPTITPLYQKTRAHYFVGMAVNPERSFGIQSDGPVTDFSTGRYEITRSTPHGVVRVNLDGIERLALPAHSLPFDPTFLSNISIEPTCRDSGVEKSFFFMQNLNEENVTLTIKPSSDVLTLPPGRSKIEIDDTGTMNAYLRTPLNDEDYRLQSLTPITSDCVTGGSFTITPGCYLGRKLLVAVQSTSANTLEEVYIRLVSNAAVTSKTIQFAPFQEHQMQIEIPFGVSLPNVVELVFTFDGVTYVIPFSVEGVPGC